MSSKRVHHHQNLVLERLGTASEADSPARYQTVADHVETFDLAEKTAKRLATEQPGHVFVVARTWPAVVAKVEQRVAFVNPDSEGHSHASEATSKPATSPTVVPPPPATAPASAKPVERPSTTEKCGLF